MVSLGLLFYLVLLVDWDRTIDILQSVQAVNLSYIPLITLLGFVFASLRWKLLLHNNNIQFSFNESFWGYWLGLFYSIFLPGVIGGDIIRAGLVVNKRKCPVITSATIVLMERMIGVIVLFLSMAMILLITPRTIKILIGASNTTQLIIIASIILASTAVVLAGRAYWPELLTKFGNNKLTRFISKPLLTLALISRKALIISMLLSFLFEAADIFTVYFLARALNINPPLVFFFAIMPVVYVITILPISLGGLGVREGVLFFLLSQTGVQASDAVTLSFLIYINRILVGGVAGLIQLIYNVQNGHS
jgi:glycosyltransferase 2 family protein